MACLFPVEDAIVLVRWPALTTAGVLDRLLDELVATAAEAATPVAFVIDLRVALSPMARARHDAAQKFAGAYEKTAHRIAGVSCVITSPLVRGVVTAVHWLSPAPFPTHVAQSVPEAVRWAHALVTARQSPPNAAPHG